MSPCQPSIRPLAAEVQAKIKSSISITSLNDVVLQLVQNALDAGSNKIHIELDFPKSYCAVTDDGVGIPVAEFSETGHLGQMHCTSKNQKSSRSYGRHGCFLSCLSSLSLLSITSKYDSYPSQGTLMFHRSKVISRSLEKQDQPAEIFGKHGTKVVVRDLFGNLPVRLKYLATRFESMSEIEKEFGDLKHDIVALVLAYSTPVNIRLVHAEGKLKYVHRPAHGAAERQDGRPGRNGSTFHLENICSTLSQAACIPQCETSLWRNASARTSLILIRAAFSLYPAPSKQVQFISIGNKPLNIKYHASIFNEINSMFELSSFARCEDDFCLPENDEVRYFKDRRLKSGRHMMRQLNGAGKGIDKWPMFYIRIEPRSDGISDGVQEVLLDDNNTKGYFHQLLELVRSLVFQFLYSNQFRPRNRTKGEHYNSDRDHDQSVSSHGTVDPAHKQAASRFETPSTLSLRGVHSPNLSRPPYHAFDKWSRIKSSNQQGFYDILAGLPGSKKWSPDATKRLEYSESPLQSQEPTVDNGKAAAPKSDIDSDMQLLLENIREDSSIDAVEQGDSADTARNLDTSFGPNHGSQSGQNVSSIHNSDEPIIWIDPRNGAEVRIDARTGLILPNLGKSRVLRSVSINQAWNIDRPGTYQTKIGTNSKTKPDSRAIGISKFIDAARDLSFCKTETPITSVVSEGSKDLRSGKSDCNGEGREIQSCQKLDEYFARGVSASEYRLRKSDLWNTDILGQVDHKFILARMSIGPDDTTGSKPKGPKNSGDSLLLLIDQHAADERIRVEKLYQELCDSKAIQLATPVIFEVSGPESKLFERRKGYFNVWAVEYEVKSGPLKSVLRPSTPHRIIALPESKQVGYQVVVTALPELIAERCRLEPRVLVDLLRKEIWSGNTKDAALYQSKFPPFRSDEERSRDRHIDTVGWISKISHCPKGLVEMINSRACRSAIMFNDELSREQCRELVGGLARCVFPFQCAHGRPGVVVLTSLDSMAAALGSGLGRVALETEEFGDKWRAWCATAIESSQ